MFIWTTYDIARLIVFGMVFFFALAIGYRTYFRQSLCKHEKGVNETGACNAICRECGKNLGFIGSWNEKPGQQK